MTAVECPLCHLRFQTRSELEWHGRTDHCHRPHEVSARASSPARATRRPGVVVGVDGSSASLDALAFAADEARRRDALLTVVTAWDQPDAIRLASYGVPVPDTAVQRNAAATVAHQAIVDVLGEDGSRLDIEVVAPRGSPAAALLECARGATLLVVGSRGHSGLGGLILGSVSLHCVLHAGCPVTVVRTPRHAPPAIAAARAEPGAGRHVGDLDQARRDASATFL